MKKEKKTIILNSTVRYTFFPVAENFPDILFMIYLRTARLPKYLLYNLQRIVTKEYVTSMNRIKKRASMLYLYTLMLQGFPIGAIEL